MTDLLRPSPFDDQRDLEFFLSDYVKRHIRSVPGFPKPEIKFLDLLTASAENRLVLPTITRILRARYAETSLHGIAAIDSRGFVYGAPLAVELQVPFIPIRKIGKLPPPTTPLRYDCEYASGALEVCDLHLAHKDRVLLIDDILATGGTAAAAVELLRTKGVDVVEAVFIVEIPELQGRSRLEATSVYSVVRT